ncbi:hypothetical protein K1719_022379 [Acacia pycnantha]|nr:hypothetical protein K1719_022379 [Acacia pycnantha]
MLRQLAEDMHGSIMKRDNADMESISTLDLGTETIFVANGPEARLSVQSPIHRRTSRFITVLPISATFYQLQHNSELFELTSATSMEYMNDADGLII